MWRKLRDTIKQQKTVITTNFGGDTDSAVHKSLSNLQSKQRYQPGKKKTEASKSRGST